MDRPLRWLGVSAAARFECLDGLVERRFGSDDRAGSRSADRIVGVARGGDAVRRLFCQRRVGEVIERLIQRVHGIGDLGEVRWVECEALDVGEEPPQRATSSHTGKRRCDVGTVGAELPLQGNVGRVDLQPQASPGEVFRETSRWLDQRRPPFEAGDGLVPPPLQRGSPEAVGYANGLDAGIEVVEGSSHRLGHCAYVEIGLDVERTQPLADWLEGIGHRARWASQRGIEVGVGVDANDVTSKRLERRARAGQRLSIEHRQQVLGRKRNPLSGGQQGGRFDLDRELRESRVQCRQEDGVPKVRTLGLDQRNRLFQRQRLIAATPGRHDGERHRSGEQESDVDTVLARRAAHLRQGNRPRPMRSTGEAVTIAAFMGHHGTMTFDLLIKNGTVVDGTGAPRMVADVAVKDGVIAAVGADLGSDAHEIIDASGLLVTPGFVDIHTHYDGQVTWDEELAPSSVHGVTTLVMGNCGVGFAPVRPGSEEWLIQLMEGVEDIPGTALNEGMQWSWETFPEYLDFLDTRSFTVDVATQVAHGAVRGYVMGERGARNEPADADDIAEMRQIVADAVAAGALGVSTSRTLTHKAIDGEPVPGTFAAEDELFALGYGLRDGGGGVFELAPAGVAGEDVLAPPKEMAWMRKLAAEIEMPVTFAMLQVDVAPDMWKDLMAESLAAAEEGAELYPQVAARPFGMMIGFPTHHPFAKRPSYRAIADLPIEERIVELRKPDVKAAILAEDDLPIDPNVIFDGVSALLAALPDKLFVVGDPPDYEPTESMSVLSIAEANGVDPLEAAYDAMCEQDGQALLMFPLLNYSENNHDAIREQLTHPRAVSGLSDGGAHCGMICDASIPTFMLTHWARDRSRGEGLDLEWVVNKQTKATADLFGLGDRGVIEVGKRADLNVIDFDGLQLRAPRLVHDLPAGGRRLVQQAEGYVATVVAGEVTRRDDTFTGARPGRLVRGRR